MANVSSSNGIEKYPLLRFNGYNNPWMTQKLGDLGTFIKGAPLSKADISNEGNPFILYGELYTTYSEVTHSVKRKTDKTVEQQFYSKIGDVIMPTSGETPEDIATASCIMLPDVILAGDLLIYRTEQIDGRFVSYAIKNKVNKQISSVAQGKSVVHVRADELAKICITFPALDEQKKILNLLELLDTRIATQQSLIETLKKYKRGLLDKLLEDNSTDANWHIVRLQDVANGFDYGMNSAATTFDGVHKYIRITDIDDDSRQYLSDDIVSPSDTPEEKYRVSDNDILFARTGASVGKSYLYTPDDGALYFAGFLIRISVKKEYDSYFVYLNTLTSKYEKWLRLESMRSGQPGVNAEQYRNYAFRCPNYQTQVKIANIIKGIDSKILKERMSLSKLNSLKNGLLQQLFI